MGISMQLRNDVVDLYNDPRAVKIFAFLSQDIELHLISIDSTMAPDPNTIILANIAMKEVDKNLIQAMNTGRSVSVLSALTLKNTRKVYQIRCKVKEFQTTGPLYEKFLDQLKVRSEDLAGVWVLEPVEIIDRTLGLDFGKTIV